MIQVPEAARLSGLEVLRDNVPIAEVLWGSRAAIDSGTHRISVRAPGHKPWQKEVEIVGEANYERTIPVVGGGTISMRHVDTNCRVIKNCTGGGYPCAAKARTVNIAAASPQPPMGNPPAGFTQPGLGNDTNNAGQWLLLDVTAVKGPQ